MCIRDSLHSFPALYADLCIFPEEATLKPLMEGHPHDNERRHLLYNYFCRHLLCKYSSHQRPPRHLFDINQHAQDTCLIYPASSGHLFHLPSILKTYLACLSHLLSIPQHTHTPSTPHTPCTATPHTLHSTSHTPHTPCAAHPTHPQTPSTSCTPHTPGTPSHTRHTLHTWHTPCTPHTLYTLIHLSLIHI